MYRKRVWDVEGNGFQDLRGARALGDDDGGFDWGALTNAIAVGTTGAANVIKAASANPYAYSSYAVPNSAYGSGYPVAGATATLSTSGGLWVGIGLVALAGILLLRPHK